MPSGTQRDFYTITRIGRASVFEPNGARRSKARTRSFLNLSPQSEEAKGKTNMLILLVVVLILMSLGSLPAWPHSRDWGYYPSGGLGAVVIVLLILLLLGRI